MGYSKLIKNTLFAAPLLFSTSSFAQTTIDVMVLYSDGVEQQYGQGLDSRINQVISVSNDVYENSQLDIELRLVHQQKITYSDSAHPQTVLQSLTCDLNQYQTQGTCTRGNAFKDVSSLRAEYGADMVVMLRPYSTAHGGVCGIAWVGGANTNGDFSHDVWKETAMSVVGLDGPCADWVTAHELGHNMGLTHSSYQDSRGGTYPWAWGYAKSNNFATIMSYAWVYGSQTRKVFNFSTPNLDCYGSPCGINKNQAGGADAVHALSQTAPKIANYVEAVVEDNDVNNNDGSDVSNLAKLKQDLENAKAKLQQLKAARKAAKENFIAVRKEYRNAKKAYNKAYRVYERSVTRLNNLLTRVNTAIAAYNASGNLSVTKQQRLYNKAINLINKYNEQVNVVNANANKVNSLVPAYANAINAYEQASKAFEQTKSQVINQKDVVNQAREAFLAAKAS